MYRVARAVLRRPAVRQGIRQFATEGGGGGGPNGFGGWWKAAGRTARDKASKTTAAKPPSGGPGTALTVGAMLLYLLSQRSPSDELPVITVQEMSNRYLSKGYVDRLVVINRTACRVHLRQDAPAELPRQLGIYLGAPDQFEGRIEAVQKEMGIPVQEFIPVQYINESSMMEDFMGFVPTLVGIASLLVLWRFTRAASSQMGGGGAGGGKNVFNVGKAQTSGKKDLKSLVKFTDVAGLHQAKQEIMEFVDFLNAPQKFETVGARLPKGGLLVGPPGTGKTLLAKAVAGEAGVPFYSMSGSDFIEMFVGVGPSRVRDLFSQARETAPSIIFIDEIDAVGRKRGGGGFSGGGNDERENTLNQLLVEMDGFSSTTNVVVLAGTNRSDVLDPALTRAGRFDRQIHVSNPDISDREEIFKVHLRPLTLSNDATPTIVARRMAALSPGMAGADIANVCNEAAIYAARRDSKAVELFDFENAMERIIGGLKKQNNMMSPHDRLVVSIHEAGHAVAGWFSKHSDPLLKVSIVPRSSGALGYAQYMPEDTPLHSKEALIDRIRVTLAGRAAEELFIGKITTGAGDDLDKVNKLATSMVSIYGMNEAVGLLSYPPKEQEFFRPYSNKTGRLIDAEKMKLVNEQYEFVKELLLTHETLLRKLSARLLEKEVLVNDDLVEILGDRPFGVRSEYAKFIDVRKELDLEHAARDKAQAEKDTAAKNAEQDTDSKSTTESNVDGSTHASESEGGEKAKANA